MKLPICLLLVLLSQILNAQSEQSKVTHYEWLSLDKTFSSRLSLDKDYHFEFIIDETYDCTPAYAYYGKGNYQVSEDAILLVFDSIPTLVSSCQIDSSVTQHQFSTVDIKVFDQSNQPMDGLALSWGKSIQRGRSIIPRFFEQKFDQTTQLKLDAKTDLNFVRIEKDGYYWAEIPIPAFPSKDYQITVILRPKPAVLAQSYISNTAFSLFRYSNCELHYSIYDTKVELVNKQCNHTKTSK